MPTDAHFDGTITPADEAEPIKEASVEELLEGERTRASSLEAGLVAMTDNRDAWLARAEAAEAGLRKVALTVEEALGAVAALREAEARESEAAAERAAKAEKKAAKKAEHNPG